MINEQIKNIRNARIREIADKCVNRTRGDFGMIIEGGVDLEKFTELIIEEAAKAHLCDSDGVVGKYSDSDRYYFETLMKKQLGLV
jgi:hypothetical protein